MKQLLEERGELILRPDQEQTLEKFRSVDDKWPNVLILDEMGTGKTVTTICHDLNHRKKLGNKGFKTLVITMNGAMTSTWEEHFRWIVPEMKCIILDPKARGLSWHEFRRTDAEVLIMHWEAVHIMLPDYLSEFTWGHVIADEVHKIKNRDTKMAKSLKKVPCARKSGLSGTPSTGFPADLWSILNWLYPKEQWGTGGRGFWKFFEHYTHSEVQYPQGYRKVTGPKNEEQLQRFIAPFTVRHLKKEVLSLEEPTFQTINVKMTEKQRKAYEQMKEDMVAWIEITRGEDDTIEPLIANHVIARFVRLQQFACAYATINEDGSVSLSEPSSKLDEVMIKLQERLDEGGQVVIFSAFKQMIYLLRARLEKAKISFVELTGDVPATKRSELVESFQEGKAQVFIGTIKAGGTGIELTAASTVMFISREWAPHENNQAISRLHRQGQKDVVQVIDFVTEDCVEPDKNTQIELKWSWVQKMLGDEKVISPFS